MWSTSTHMAIRGAAISRTSSTCLSRCLIRCTEPPRIRAPQSRHSTSKSPSKKAGNTHPSPSPSLKPWLPYKPHTPKPKPNPYEATGAAEQEAKNEKRIRGHRYVTFVGSAAIAVCLGAWSASLWLQSAKPAPTYVYGQEPCHPTGRPSVKSPLEFDKHLDKNEASYGITKLRKKMANEAVGHVLEVAMGTGRNFEWYSWGKMTESYVSRAERAKEMLQKVQQDSTMSKVSDVKEMESYTGVDISPAMMNLGLRCVRQFVPHGVDELPKKKPKFKKLAEPFSFPNDPAPEGQDDMQVVNLLNNLLRIIKCDAQQHLPPPPNNVPKYDTVLQTFGLCSVRDPIGLIRNMASVTKPETGRIILLEHGRGWWDFVNRLLDRTALDHFDRFGCWWNRDLQQIVDDAVEQIPGLEVVEFKRPGWVALGTHVWVEFRVREDEDGQVVDTKKKTGGGGGWYGWLSSAMSAISQAIITPKSNSADDESRSKPTDDESKRGE